MDAVERRRAAFAALHESGCFVVPNPWDAGSARILRRLGFQALATTSAGLQFIRAATTFTEEGSFAGLGGAAAFAALNALFGTPAADPP
jgi:hypothetical protein